MTNRNYQRRQIDEIAAGGVKAKDRPRNDKRCTIPNCAAGCDTNNNDTIVFTDDVYSVNYRSQ